MNKSTTIRWSLLGGCVAIGLIASLFSDDSGRFVFAAFTLAGIALYYLYDYAGERLLYGTKLAAELKEARDVLREARRLSKRGRAQLSTEVRAAIHASCEALEEAIATADRAAMVKQMRELTGLAESHLFRFRKAPWREYLEPIALAALVALTLRGFVVEAFEIPSGSMIPTLAVGDKIFVNKLAFGIRVPFMTWRLAEWSLPSRGEVVVFIYPLDPSENFVKRVIGLPGDTVEVRDGFLHINGEVVARRYLGQRRLWDKSRQGHWFEANYQVYEETQGDHTYLVMGDPQRLRLNFPPTKVPKDHIFVLGDNRDNSSDSREWGMVPTRNLIGSSMFIWWSYGPTINTERYFRPVR